jgi:hypothetical protein
MKMIIGQSFAFRNEKKKEKKVNPPRIEEETDPSRGRAPVGNANHADSRSIFALQSRHCRLDWLFWRPHLPTAKYNWKCQIDKYVAHTVKQTNIEAHVGKIVRIMSSSQDLFYSRDVDVRGTSDLVQHKRQSFNPFDIFVINFDFVVHLCDAIFYRYHPSTRKIEPINKAGENKWSRNRDETKNDHQDIFFEVEKMLEKT